MDDYSQLENRAMSQIVIDEDSKGNPLIAFIFDGPSEKMMERIETLRICTGMNIMVLDSMIEGVTEIMLENRIHSVFHIKQISDLRAQLLHTPAEKKRINEVEKPYGKKYRHGR